MPVSLVYNMPDPAATMAKLAWAGGRVTDIFLQVWHFAPFFYFFYFFLNFFIFLFAGLFLLLPQL